MKKSFFNIGPRSSKTVEIVSKTGIFVIDKTLKLKCLTKKVGPLSSLACSESRCFVVEKASENRYEFTLGDFKDVSKACAT
jgi:hypothetical protein